MIASIALLLSVLLVAGVISLLTTAILMAENILRPPRMTDGKAVYVLKRLSPGDLGLQFVDERIHVRDSAHPSGPPIELAAWWIPAPPLSTAKSEKCVLILHGYADGKVGGIAWAPTWHSLGFNILAIDLRAHGESTGRDVTAGFFERHDVNELLDRLRSIRPDEMRQLVVFGVSMGAAVALATAALREDLSAVVVDSPFADYRTAIRRHFDRAGLPTGITATLAIWFAQLKSGAKFAEVRPLTLLPQIRCRIMLIRGSEEEFISPDESKALDKAMLDRADRSDDINWIVADVHHLGALHADSDLYKRKLEAFLISPDVG